MARASLPAVVATVATVAFGAFAGSARVASAQPRVAVEPQQIDFGPVPLAATATRPLTLRNLGDATLTVARVTVHDPFNRGAYLVAGPAPPLSIAAGASADLSVEFHPVSDGFFPATIEVESDDPQARSTQLTLDGRGVEASWQVSPRSLAFRSLLLEDAGPPQMVTLQNSGLVAVELAAPRLEGPGASQFRVISSGITTLAVGRAETYAVTCQPSSAGQHVATLVLSARGAMAPVSVSLAATAVAATLAHPPVDWSFGAVPIGERSASRTLDITLAPPGISGRLIAVRSSNTAFTVDTSDTITTLAADQSTSVRVRFEPTFGGDSTAVVTVEAAGTLGPLPLARLHGRGVAAGSLDPGDCSVSARPSASRGTLLLVALSLLLARARRGSGGLGGRFFQT